MITCSIIKKTQLEGAHRLDAEYYQPEYLKLIDNLDKLGAVPIREVATNPKRKFKPRKDEIFQYIEISEVDLSTGEYNKSKILGENTPDRAQWVVQQNDIIISTVRPIRNAVSLINENIKNLVCSSGFAVLETQKIEPEYLFIYLKTRPVVNLLDRQTTATMYPAVTIEDILNIKVYLGNEIFRQEIKNEIIETQKELEKSKSLYSQAEDLLLEELRLKDFKVNEDLTYSVKLSDIKSAHRADAEYFQPKYGRLKEKIKNFKVKLLGDLVFMKKGFEPGSELYQENGKLFIRVSNISKQGLIEKDQKYIGDELYQGLKKIFEPNVGEILLTKDATPGITYVLKEHVEGIISSGILRLSLKENIEPEYLALCINTILGKMQVEQDSGGSIIEHWKPEQIKKLQIPILPGSIQQQIAKLVRQSHEARKKAKELLEEAKQKVENLIEANK